MFTLCDMDLESLARGDLFLYGLFSRPPPQLYPRAPRSYLHPPKHPYFPSFERRQLDPYATANADSEAQGCSDWCGTRNFFASVGYAQLQASLNHRSRGKWILRIQVNHFYAPFFLLQGRHRGMLFHEKAPLNKQRPPPTNSVTGR